MSLPRICPSCQCIFHQDFVCTTCGAEKLRDETVRVQQKQIEALQAELAACRKEAVFSNMPRPAECLEAEIDAGKVKS